ARALPSGEDGDVYAVAVERAEIDVREIRTFLSSIECRGSAKSDRESPRAVVEGTAHVGPHGAARVRDSAFEVIAHADACGDERREAWGHSGRNERALGVIRIRPGSAGRALASQIARRDLACAAQVFTEGARHDVRADASGCTDFTGAQ